MRYYIQLTALLVVIALLMLKCCNRQEPIPAKVGEVERLKERVKIVKEITRERDTIYINRVRTIVKVAPAECDTFIKLVVAECDTLVQTKEVLIAVQDSVIVADSTVIVAQAVEIKKQRRHKRLAVLGMIILGLLAVVK